MIVFAKQHRGLQALATAVFLVSCTDGATPVAPNASGAPVVASRPSMDRTSASANADDVIDALDRISPAFGESSAANQVRGALKDLIEAVLKNDTRGTQRDAADLSQALDHLASLGDQGIGAEIDAVRLVADARK